MKNIIDYVEKEMSSLPAVPFNNVDSLVLSQFSYIYFEEAVPLLTDLAAPIRMAELLKAELFESMFHDVRDVESNRKLLFALAASPRFRNIQVNYYVNNIDAVQEKQFSAVTFLLEDQTAYIAYRGTDATFVGWKEDFNMAFISPVPSQEESVGYLNTVAALIAAEKLRIGGHSKGGNLAVYAAMNCEENVRDRIINVYDHDGPGFTDGVLASPAFLSIRDRITKTMPQSSIIGMLLQHQENYSVVESNRYGIMQHDPFSWSVDEHDFRYVESVTNGALYLHKTLNQWLETLTEEKRKLFVDALYQVITTTDTATVYEFSDNWRKGAIAMLGAVKNADPETKKFVARAINELVRLTLKNVRLPKQPWKALPAADNETLPGV
jgi:hypothetical protein